MLYPDFITERALKGILNVLSIRYILENKYFLFAYVREFNKIDLLPLRTSITVT